MEFNATFIQTVYFCSAKPYIYIQYLFDLQNSITYADALKIFLRTLRLSYEMI